MIYTGDGAFLVGVPARDLTSEEVEKYGADTLIESGLYKARKAPKKEARPLGEPKSKPKES